MTSFEQKPLSEQEVNAFGTSIERTDVVMRLRMEEVLRSMWKAAATRIEVQNLTAAPSDESQFEATWDPIPFEEDPDA